MDDMVTNETVTLTKREYEELLDAAEFLACLEAAGVDNWVGYSIAYEMYEEEDE